MHFGLGYLHWRLRQYDEAKAEFERELATDPRHAQALAYLGDIEMKHNNPEGALLLLRQAIQLRNDIRIAYLDLGAILADRTTIRKQLPPSARPRNWIPPNPMPTFVWDACTRPRGIRRPRKRNLPNFANCTRRLMKT